MYPNSVPSSQPTRSTLPLGATDADQVILRGIAEARVDDAAAARARAHWLARQAEEEATLTGALCDLAERRAPVRLTVQGGHLVRGVVDHADPTLTVVITPDGMRTIVRTDRVVQVRTEPGHSPATAPVRRHIPAVASCGFTDQLRRAGAERAETVICTADGAVVTGRLRALGHDVLTVLAGEDASMVLLALATIVAASGIDDG